MPNNQDRQIQIAVADDYPFIANIYNEYISAGTATMDATLKTKDDIAGWVEKFNDRECLYTLKQHEKVIGWGIIKRYSDREGYRVACETAIYLTGTALGKGHGSFLKKYVIEQCKAFNYHHLVAKIWANNHVSIDYNLKLGYSIVGTQKEIGFRNGKWLDVVIMQLILK